MTALFDQTVGSYRGRVIAGDPGLWQNIHSGSQSSVDSACVCCRQ